MSIRPSGMVVIALEIISNTRLWYLNLFNRQTRGIYVPVILNICHSNFLLHKKTSLNRNFNSQIFCFSRMKRKCFTTKKKLITISVCVVAKCVSVTDVVWRETLFTVISKTSLYLKNNFNHDKLTMYHVLQFQHQSFPLLHLPFLVRHPFSFYTTANECNNQY